MPHDARFDDEIYQQRSVVEPVIDSLKPRFCDRLRMTTRFGQFANSRLEAPSNRANSREATNCIIRPSKRVQETHSFELMIRISFSSMLHEDDLASNSIISALSGHFQAVATLV